MKKKLIFQWFYISPWKAGMSDVDSNWTRLASDGTYLGLIRIICQYIWSLKLNEPWSYDLNDLIKSPDLAYLLPIWSTVEPVWKVLTENYYCLVICRFFFLRSIIKRQGREKEEEIGHTDPRPQEVAPACMFTEHHALHSPSPQTVSANIV